MPSRLAGLFLLTFGLALAAGCKSSIPTTSIKTLLDDPSRFDHQVVRISGTVTHSLGIAGYGGYTIDDGTGSLPVVTQSNGAPRDGAKIGVEGEFRSAYTIGASSGAVLIEHQRVSVP